MNTQIHKNYDIPDNAIIPCPKEMFKHIRAERCSWCDVYKGVVVLDDAENWGDNHRVLCAHPIMRRTQIMDI